MVLFRWGDSKADVLSVTPSLEECSTREAKSISVRGAIMLLGFVFFKPAVLIRSRRYETDIAKG